MPPYSLHPSYAYHQKMLDNLLAQSGRSLDDWLELLKRQAFISEPEQLQWLKATQGLGTQQAALLIERAQGKGRPEDYDPQALVDAQFHNKTALRPIYDTVLAWAFALSKDVRACPCATMVPFYREHVFAQLKPATKTRLELGLCLRGEAFTARLKDTGGTAKKDRITHRIDLSCIGDFDAEAQRCMQQAWARADA